MAEEWVLRTVAGWASMLARKSVEASAPSSDERSDDKSVRMWGRKSDGRLEKGLAEKLVERLDKWSVQRLAECLAEWLG